MQVAPGQDTERRVPMPDKLLPIVQMAADTAPDGLDLTDGAHLRDTEDLAAILLEHADGPTELGDLEGQLVADTVRDMERMYRAYLPKTEEAEVFADLINDLRQAAGL